MLENGFTKTEVTLLGRILGVLALVFGVLGLLLPVLPGWLLIFIGLELIGVRFVFLERFKTYVKTKAKIKENKKEAK